jgi:thiol-disulfide isomerase/thioredoxin
MKVALTLLLLVATGTSVFAAETAPASPAADEAYQRFRAVRYAQVPRLADVQETSRLQMKQHDDSSRLAEKFYEQFPADARKWEVVGVAVNSPRQFSGPDAAADQAAWEKKRNEWRRMLLADVSVPANIWTTVAEWTIGDMAGSRGRPVRDLAWAGEVVAQMAARVPASERRKFAEQAYLDSLQKKDPAAAERFLRTRVGPTETNAAVKEMAAGRLRIVEAMSAPLDLKFTAADGREVDLAKLRGKVVLVDFWATWCVPCLKEMPYVRAAYKKFHDRGFEVVGISFDKAPGAQPRGMERSAAQVDQFARENDMPWPHHYDGNYWGNEFGRRFAIASLPTTFLLGKDGRIATTEAHGEKLAVEIERLLGQ